VAKRSSKNKSGRTHGKLEGEKPDDQPQKKPTFEMEALEPRILLSATWIGTDGDDTFSGSNAEADEAHGLAGDDVLHGDNMDDQLFGGDGNDQLFGDNHADTLDGGAGDDVLDGGRHDDVLISGGGNDTMSGGQHDDTFRFTGAQDGDVITVDGGLHNDTLDLSAYNNSSISDDGSSLTVDLGGGQSFTVNYSNVETIETAEGSYVPGSIGKEAPTVVDDSASTTEDTAVTTGNVLANDSDPDGDALSVSGHTQGANGSVTYNGDGTFTYTPDADFSGTDSFTYTADDGQGNTTTGTVTVAVDASQDAPVVANDGASTTEDTAVTTGNVLANDSDPDGDALSVSGHTQGANGSVTYNGDGTFTYTPDADFSGTDSFTYTADDGQGNTTTGTVTVAVDASQDAPVVANDGSTDDGDAITQGGDAPPVPQADASSPDAGDAAATDDAGSLVGGGQPDTHVGPNLTDGGETSADGDGAAPQSGDAAPTLNDSASETAQEAAAPTAVAGPAFESVDGSDDSEWTESDLEALEVIQEGADDGLADGDDLGYYVNAAVGLAGDQAAFVRDDAVSRFEFERDFELPKVPVSNAAGTLTEDMSSSQAATATEAFDSVDVEPRDSGARPADPVRYPEDRHEHEQWSEGRVDREGRSGFATRAGGWLAGLWGMVRGVGRRPHKNE